MVFMVFCEIKNPISFGPHLKFEIKTEKINSSCLEEKALD